MKKCTQCGQILSDETKFCIKCGGASFEPTADTSAGAYQAQASYQQPAQQPTYQQPAYQQPAAPGYQQPAYQQPSQQQYYPPVSGENEPVSIGMNLLFLILSCIPLVNIIYAIVVAASSKKKSYRNLAIAWFIALGIGIVLSIILSSVIWSLFLDFFDNYGSFNYSF